MISPWKRAFCSGLQAQQSMQPFTLQQRAAGCHWASRPGMLLLLPHTLKLPSTLRSVAWEAPHCFSLVLTTNR